MGIVSEHLGSIIAKQVEERSLVVWYDPGADYRAVAERLVIPGTIIARYDGSFLKLRSVYAGFCIEFALDRRVIITSPVRSITVASASVQSRDLM